MAEEEIKANLRRLEIIMGDEEDGASTGNNNRGHHHHNAVTGELKRFSVSLNDCGWIHQFSVWVSSSPNPTDGWIHTS